MKTITKKRLEMMRSGQPRLWEKISDEQYAGLYGEANLINRSDANFDASKK